MTFLQRDFYKTKPVVEYSVFGEQSDPGLAVWADGPAFAEFIDDDVDRFKNSTARTFNLGGEAVVDLHGVASRDLYRFIPLAVKVFCTAKK